MCEEAAPDTFAIERSAATIAPDVHFNDRGMDNAINSGRRHADSAGPLVLVRRYAIHDLVMHARPFGLSGRSCW